MIENGELHLENLPYTAFQFDGMSHVFVGASDGPTPQADIPGVAFVQNRFALTVVAMDEP